jgi:predicted metal-binding membrane protein
VMFRQAAVIPWAAMLVLSVAGWATTVLLARAMPAMAVMPGMAAAPVPAASFVAIWAAMMAAMMFPSAAPTVALFAAMQRSSARGRWSIPSGFFVGGYLSVWTLAGILAYLLFPVVPALGMSMSGLRASNAGAAGAALMLAGLYQWSPVKNLCLRHCRSPLGFLLGHWLEGLWGAFRMGLGHGVYCAGCCAGLMAVLFVMGAMNLGWMFLVAAAIGAEKTLPGGSVIARVIGLGIGGLGLLTLFSAVKL